MAARDPDIAVAVAIHRLAVAQRAVREAEAAAKRAGFDPRDLTAAIDLLSADPDAIAGKQARLGAVLVALRAAHVEVEADVVDRTSDETPSRRAERLWRDGYLSAVLGDDGSPLMADPDSARWATGWAAFHAAKEDFEKTGKRRASA